MEGTISLPFEAKPRFWRRLWTHVLQALWIVAVIYSTQLLIVSIRPGYVELMRVCTEPVCEAGQLTPQGVASLRSLSISLQAFSVIQLILLFTIAIIYGVISFLIFRTKYNEPFALFVSLILLLFGVFSTNYVDVLRNVQPVLADLVDILPGITLISFAIICYLFPDGHFVPRWTRWAAVGWVVVPFALIIAIVVDAYDRVFGLFAFSLLVLLATCLIAPVYRYRKLSSRAQRQQLKWVLFGLTQLLFTLLVVIEILPLLFPILDVTGSLPNLISMLFQAISLMLFPITVGIAMLRHRFWNVDLVLNRTLVYVPLTSILTVIYTTSLAISQRLFTTATGEQPEAVAIFTTIVLTTTFSPIKNALQSYVDKNFKDVPSSLKELKELDKQLTQVVQALDRKSLAQRVVESVMQAHQTQSAALYLREGERMVLAYATPNWVWADGEVSILLSELSITQTGYNLQDYIVFGRFLLGQRRDREDYTLDELEDIRAATLPIIRNMVKLISIQADE